MTKIQTAAQIILQSNLEKLAEVHGVTVAQVVEGLRAGQTKLVQQFAALAEAGAAAAVDLQRAGRISLI